MEWIMAIVIRPSVLAKIELVKDSAPTVQAEAPVQPEPVLPWEDSAKPVVQKLDPADDPSAGYNVDDDLFAQLNIFAETKKGTLMMVHSEKGLSYKVISWKPATKEVHLKTTTNLDVYAKLAKREADIYLPQWR
jgi:hypothetical protein